MAVPIIIGLGAAAVSAYGVKKGVDAKGDFDSAKKMNRQANEIYESAQERLETNRELAQNALEQLGETKLSIYNDSIISFVKSFQKIKNIDFQELNIDGESMTPPDVSELKQLCDSSLQLQDAVKGGVTALGAGGLAGFAAYGSVGTLATASTGTAIGSLSGAAATNATLAWLGGGSLASGGMGVAGGTTVLGGIVAAPVLAVGGMILASKAEAAKEDAYSNRLKAELAAEQMETAMTVTSAIEKQFIDMDRVLNKLNDIFQPLYAVFQELVERSVNYLQYSKIDKKCVYATVATIQTLKMLLDTPMLNDEGLPTQFSKDIIDHAPELCDEVEQIALTVIDS